MNNTTPFYQQLTKRLEQSLQPKRTHPTTQRTPSLVTIPIHERNQIPSRYTFWTNITSVDGEKAHTRATRRAGELLEQGMYDVAITPALTPQGKPLKNAYALHVLKPTGDYQDPVFALPTQHDPQDLAARGYTHISNVPRGIAVRRINDYLRGPWQHIALAPAAYVGKDDTQIPLETHLALYGKR